MSQLQKLKAKQNKVKILFSFERTIEGIEITVKSQKLGDLVRYFNQNYESFNDPMVLAIYRSLNYTQIEQNRYRQNTLINGHYINLTFLNNLTTSKTLIFKINNVFTNDEIKNYLELFETYLLKIKQLSIRLNMAELRV